MHNFFAKYAFFFDICKHFLKNLVFCKGQKAYRNEFFSVCGAVYAEPKPRQTATRTIY